MIEFETLLKTANPLGISNITDLRELVCYARDAFDGGGMERYRDDVHACFKQMQGTELLKAIRTYKGFADTGQPDSSPYDVNERLSSGGSLNDGQTKWVTILTESARKWPELKERTVVFRSDSTGKFDGANVDDVVVIDQFLSCSASVREIKNHVTSPVLLVIDCPSGARVLPADVGGLDDRETEVCEPEYEYLLPPQSRLKVAWAESTGDDWLRRTFFGGYAPRYRIANVRVLSLIARVSCRSLFVRLLSWLGHQARRLGDGSRNRGGSIQPRQQP